MIAGYHLVIKYIVGYNYGFRNAAIITVLLFKDLKM